MENEKDRQSRIRADAVDREAEVFVLQVEELARLAPFTIAISLLASVLTLGVYSEAGESYSALMWFCYAFAVAAFRFVIFWSFQNRASELNPRQWANLMILGNFLSGVQWGILGSVMFPVHQGAQQLYVVMMVVCLIGGSITSYTPVRFAYAAFAVPASLPPIAYLNFVYGGAFGFAGITGIVFASAALYLGQRLHRHTERSIRLQVQNRDLMQRVEAANAKLARDNQDLAFRAEMQHRSKLTERSRAYMLATHIDHTPLPVIECDPQYQLLAWNMAAEKVFGYSFDEAVGQNLVQLLLPEDTQSKVEPFVARLFRERKPDSIEVEGITKSGEHMTCTCNVTPIFSETGEPLRVAIIVSLPAIKKASQFAPVVK
jgi:PAS domain S-box-containing protein